MNNIPLGKVSKVGKFTYMVTGDTHYMICAIPVDTVKEACDRLGRTYAGTFVPAKAVKPQ